MKIKIAIELFGLAVGLSAVITLVYFLTINTAPCLYEPVESIRVPELIMGVVTIPILALMMLERIIRGRNESRTNIETIKQKN